METISVLCVACGKPTPTCVPVSAGAQCYLHKRQKRNDCRLVVVPDPDGTEHWVQEVPHDREMYSFLEALLVSSPDVMERHRALLAKALKAVA